MRSIFRLDVLKGVNGIVATVVAVVGLAVTLGVVQPFGGGSGDALAAAAGKTQDAGSSKMTLRLAVNAGAQRFAFRGQGAFDYHTKQGTATYDYSENPGLEAVDSVRAIIHPNAFFYDFTQFGLPPDRPWVRMTPSDLSRVLGVGKGDISGALDASNDPSKFLELAKSAGDVKKAGKETLFGAKTTHYTGVLDPAKLKPRGSGEKVQIGAWVDDAGLLRRLNASSGLEVTPGQRATWSLTEDLYDFGTGVRADSPPPAQVISFSQLQSLQQGGTTPQQGLTPPG